MPNAQCPMPGKNVIRDTKSNQKVNFPGESHTSADNCLKETQGEIKHDFPPWT
jgi:hypothetical protein